MLTLKGNASNAWAVFLGLNDEHRVELGRWLKPKEETHKRIGAANPCQPPRTCLFVMLNPSTATHEVLDPTVRRCAKFAAHWGFDRLVVCNLFSLRSTNPKALRPDPFAEGDPYNLHMIQRNASSADRVVCAWGNHGKLRNRGDRVLAEIRLVRPPTFERPMCFRITDAGQPEHPLYQLSHALLMTL